MWPGPGLLTPLGLSFFSYKTRPFHDRRAMVKPSLTVLTLLTNGALLIVGSLIPMVIEGLLGTREAALN